MNTNCREPVALVGPIGADKFNLSSLITRQYKPDAGEVIRDEYTTLGFLPKCPSCQAFLFASAKKPPVKIAPFGTPPTMTSGSREVTSASRTFADLTPVALDQFTHADDNIGDRLASTAEGRRESHHINRPSLQPPNPASFFPNHPFFASQQPEPHA